MLWVSIQFVQLPMNYDLHRTTRYEFALLSRRTLCNVCLPTEKAERPKTKPNFKNTARYLVHKFRQTKQNVDCSSICKMRYSRTVDDSCSCREQNNLCGMEMWSKVVVVICDCIATATWYRLHVRTWIRVLCGCVCYRRTSYALIRCCWLVAYVFLCLLSNASHSAAKSLHTRGHTHKKKRKHNIIICSSARSTFMLWHVLVPYGVV